VEPVFGKSPVSSPKSKIVRSPLLELLMAASLSDYQIRDINDEINKAMKEKYVWEVQLRNLGGPNYGVGTGGMMVDDQGREVPGQRGYKYYGRARELPGTYPMRHFWCSENNTYSRG